MKTALIRFQAMAILIFLSHSNFAQAPNLGVTAGFALFTSTGSFDNTGTATIVTGDVGNNAGAFNAFPPGTLIGQKHIVDAVAAQAFTDLETLYSDLNGRTCGYVLDAIIGSNQVLTPGVYCSGAATQLNGALILDAQNDPNAIFIIKVNGNFATGTFSDVSLVNAAVAFNVYWQINGRFDLGDGSIFRGTVVNNGAIELLGNSSLFGRGLSRAGAVTLHDNSVTLCTTPVLPITLISFDAEYDQKSAVSLHWQTAAEFNSAFFYVERSPNGINFETIGEKIAAGYSSQLLSYSFNDQKPTRGLNYYRLNLVDLNGVHKYSAVRVVNYDNAIVECSIYPNPGNKLLVIAFAAVPEISNRKLTIYNSMGIAVYSASITKQKSILDTGNLLPGIYFYNIITGNTIIQSGKLVLLQ